MERSNHFTRAKENPDRYFKIKVLSWEGLHVPCFVCKASSPQEAQMIAEIALREDLIKGYTLEEPEEINKERYENLKASEKGLDGKAK